MRLHIGKVKISRENYPHQLWRKRFHLALTAGLFSDPDIGLLGNFTAL
jgi:hypothetical protein